MTLAAAEEWAVALSALRLESVPQQVRVLAKLDLLDCLGLTVAARREEYIRSLLRGWEGTGNCTAIGHPRPLHAAGAALVNGVAIHGEDFDDTLEGSPIRVGAMVVPAVLAAAEAHGRSGASTLLGLVAGLETICRLNEVVPGAIHAGGFHPVGVLGVFGAAAGAAVTLGLDQHQMSDALGVAGSFAAGIGEFLTEGAWTKRLHAGWAAHSGYHAARVALAGFHGPRTVFDGPRSVFRTFGHLGEPDLSVLRQPIGDRWWMQNICFKPFACGTMIHPYIDCMIEMRKDGVSADEIVSVVCDAASGLVNRLWEPLAVKRRPRTGYEAKFSMPFCMALGFVDGDAGLAQFVDEKVTDHRYAQLAERISYTIDPDTEYPRNYAAHLQVQLTDGRVLRYGRSHFRGGRREPLSPDEIRTKFRRTTAWGGWDGAQSRALGDFCMNLEAAEDLSALSQFRS